MTKQEIIETWHESAEYEETSLLLEKAQQTDPERVVSVSLCVHTVNPDNTTKEEHVTWARRCRSVEVDETSASEETPTETPTGTDSGEDTGSGADNGTEGESTGTDAGTTTEPGTDTGSGAEDDPNTGSGTDAETGGEDEVDTEGE